MKWDETGDRSDGYVWACRKQINGKRHRCERSIREGSWFEKANLTIEEVLKFTYVPVVSGSETMADQTATWTMVTYYSRLGHVLP